ncbi:MAG: hypothetical protein K2K86_05835, partial [Muribaculaceae bacterium]|nr:hypothetical protein [Muribaculaceae bacterium]
TTYPNNQWDADAAFQEGRYVNTVKANHPGGDLVLGICNPGCYWDEWCAYDNFKLTGPNGDVTLVNPNFDEGFDSKRSWNNVNYKSAEKTPDTQKDGATGGDYRKCGGSPYKYGQQVELPAGTYRFSMLTFYRCGSEVSADGSKYYHHKTGVESAAYGKMNRTPYDWFQANDYDEQEADYSFPYLFMSKNETCPKDLNYEDDFGDLVAGVDVRTRVKDCWELNNGDINAMPHNNPMGPTKDGDPDAYLPYETKNKCNYFQDSGHEREAGAAFVAEPEKYYHYVEFTLTEPTKVWVGMGKNEDTSDGYWQAWADQKLEMLVAGASEEPNIQGSGTAADPYLIATAADLCEAHNLIPQDVAGDFIYFKQTADIDMKNADYDKWQALNGWGGPYNG